MNIEISVGEVLDKLTILSIKKDQIFNINQLVNINNEYHYIYNLCQHLMEDIEIQALYYKLLDINKLLWNIENNIRIKEHEKQFDDEFISLARKVYITNDQRSVIKKQINILTSSKFIEEKSYDRY